MPAADPALGLSGAMAAQQRPQMTAEPVGTAELSRAARSLESVQGNVAGQTMAIQNLSMTTQSAVLNVSSQMNALGSQIASLNSAIARLGGGVSMSAAMPMSMPQYGAVPFGGGGFGGGRFMPMASAASGAAFSGAQNIFTGIGYMSGSLTAPMFGGAGATRTSYGAELSPNMGLYQSAMIGSGLGINPADMRGMHYSRVRQAGQERFGDRLGSAAMATMTGGASLGVDAAGAMFGSRVLMPAMGFSGSGLVGGLAGGLLGAGLMMPVTATIGSVAGQAQEITAMGDQYRRNAYRMGARRPSRADRLRFGENASDLAINDLSLTGRDVQDITAGMFTGDLTRGVRDARGASDRLRELSQSVKEMARTFGGSYADMTRTASELQSLGVTANTAGLRRTTLAAGSVFGATAGEGLQAGMAGARMFAPMGLGSQGFGIGTANTSLANYAAQTGALSANTLAAVGGREGAASVMNQATANFLRGPAGTLMMAGGLGTGGFGMGNVAGLGVGGMFGRASSMASPENMLAMSLRPQDFQRQAAEDPNQLLGMQMKMARDMAQTMFGREPTRDEFAAMFGNVTGLRGAELEAAVNSAMAKPGELRESQKKLMMEASSQIESANAETRTVTGRLGRFFDESLRPAAESVASFGAAAAAGGERLMESADEALWNTKKIALLGKPSSAALDRFMAASKRGVNEQRTQSFKEMLSGNKFADMRTSSEEDKSVADQKLGTILINSPKAQAALDAIKSKLSSEKDPDRRRALAEEAVALLGDQYSSLPETGPGSEKRDAFLTALTNKTGHDIKGALTGLSGIGTVVSEEMKNKSERALSKINQAISSGEGGWKTRLSTSNAEIEQIISSSKAQEYFAEKDEDKAARMLEGMTDTEKYVLQAARSSGSDAIADVTQVAETKSIEESLKTGASALKDSLMSAKISGQSGLGGTTTDILSTLGRMNLSVEEKKRLRSQGGLSENFLQTLDLNVGEVDAREQEILKKLGMGDMENISEEQLTKIRAGAMGDEMKVKGVVTTSSSQDMSKEQASIMLQANQEYAKLAKSVEFIAAVVDQMRREGVSPNSPVAVAGR